MKRTPNEFLDRDMAEKAVIRQALERCSWVLVDAARLLRMSAAGLHKAITVRFPDLDEERRGKRARGPCGGVFGRPRKVA